MQLTISEAAAHCGYRSTTVIYRLLRSGMLRAYEAGHRGRSQLLESNPAGQCSLRDYITVCVQLRHDSPLAQAPRRAAAVPPPLERLAASQPAPNWAAVAKQLNEFLPSWPSPPWTADQVNTLVVCVEMAQEVAG